MRVNREQAALNRERILDTAGTLFREHGFDGIGVADLMKGAGFTHGGFYGHFESKEDLMAQACTRALDKAVAYWQQTVASSPKDPLGTLTRAYLSTTHRDHPGKGCVLAALGPDAARQGLQVRRSLTDGLRALVDIVAKILPGRTAAARREKALASYATFVGALVLARAVDDPKLSAEILKAASATVLDTAH